MKIYLSTFTYIELYWFSVFVSPRQLSYLLHGKTNGAKITCVTEYDTVF